MPRKYDRTIRYYDSWFADLLDPAKAFTAEECWTVILAVRDCQLNGTLEPLDSLPISIKRALSMATMGEQIIRQLERAENMRRRGSAGGRAAAQRELTPEQQAAAQMRKEQEEAERSAKEQERDQAKANKKTYNEYIATLARAAHGDGAALSELKMSTEQAITLYKAKGGVL